MNWNNELYQVFVEELSELLEDLARQLEDIKTKEDVDQQRAMANAFRIAHNIKGAARVVGHDSIEIVAHAMEDALAAIKHEGYDSKRPIMGQLFDGIRLLHAILEGQSLDETASEFVDILTSMNPDSIYNSIVPPKKVEIDAPIEKSQDKSRAIPADKAEEGNGQKQTTRIRVETARLDRMMAFVGELLIFKARLQNRNERFENFMDAFSAFLCKAPEELAVELSELNARFQSLIELDREEYKSFSTLIGQIGISVRQLRMIPLRSVAGVWKRTVRENAQLLGRLVDLEVDVGDIEVDRYLLDALRDPITHLLRNAVDHGIEEKEVRKAKAKEPEGRILIRATMRGATVEIELSDDGAGLDEKKIGLRAVERGVISAEQFEKMERHQILNLVFLSGFSTTDTVSVVSGRGIGLDVVERKLSELGGNVVISNNPTLQGTTFYLTTPISVLSTKGILVKTNTLFCTVPLINVVSALRAHRSEFQMVGGLPVLRREGEEPLNIRFLSQTIGEKEIDYQEKLNVLVVSRGGKQVGVVVKEVVSEEEFVIQKLPWNLKSIRGVNGVVVLGDGSMAFSIDVGHLIDSNLHVGLEDTANETACDAKENGQKTILVVDDSMTSRTLARDMLLTAGYEVMVAVDGDEAWNTLQHQMVDLVVTDIQMPKVDGIELTKRIRQNIDLKTLPIVLVTTLGTEEDIQKGAAAGADEYFVKGQFDSQKLIDAVERLI